MKMRDLKRELNIWWVLSTLCIALIVIPNIQVALGVFNAVNENWMHIQNYLLMDYIINALILITATGCITAVIGTALAWLIAAYDFPGRAFLKWALILPLTIPPYIGAYTYNGLLGYTGAIQMTLRDLGITVSPGVFNIMNIKGAIFIFSLFLYPYVFIVVKSYLEKNSASMIEGARVLGRSSMDIFWHIILPLSRAAVVGGVSLVVLEVLNDYGVVKYFGVPAFSTAIYRTWFALGDLDSAIKLAAVLMLFVIAVMLLEKLSRGRRRYSSTNTKWRPISRVRLKGYKGLLASAFGFIVFSAAAAVPVGQLIVWAGRTYDKIRTEELAESIFNSISAAVITTVLIMVLAIIMANYSRMNDHFVSKLYSRLTVTGYSIPAAVIAVGIIVFFLMLDRNLYGLYLWFNPSSKKLLLSTSVVMLIFAYVVRFMAIGFNSIESGFEKMGTKYFEASRTMGMSTIETFFKVDLPMLRPALISGSILVFVDILKELPLTLILRPFNHDTLATKAYEYAADEMVQEAAVSSLLIILISAVLIYFFQKVSKGGSKQHA